MTKTLRRPPVKGSADPDLPGYVLVPVRKDVPGFPKVNYSVPDGSFWRVDKRTNKPTAITTITPDGVSLGWDNCGTCTSSLSTCRCEAGISLPNAIGYIYATRGGVRPVAPVVQPTLAPVFRPPVTRKKALKRSESKRPKKTLRRTSLDKVAEEEADAAIERTLKRLKR